MGWTPHTSAELSKAGVTFGSDLGITNPNPVIVLPSSGSTTYNSSKVSDPVAAMAASGTPITVNTGSTASQLENVSANVGAALGSVGAAAGLDVSALEDMIMRNTDKNNAWSAAQAQRQMDFQERMQGIAQEFNAGEAAKNREWQEMMSNTAHQREVADLKAAGLNPILSATGGNGASVGSGAAASVGVPNGAQGNGDQSANSALVSIYSALMNAQTQMYNANLSARTNLQMAEMQKEASMYGSALAAEAAIQNAGTAYAASVYGADAQTQRQREQNAWNAEHPQSVWQAATGAGVTPSSVRDVLQDVKGILSGSGSSGQKMSYSSAKSYLANTKLGQWLGW